MGNKAFVNPLYKVDAQKDVETTNSSDSDDSDNPDDSDDSDDSDKSDDSDDSDDSDSRKGKEDSDNGKGKDSDIGELVRWSVAFTPFCLRYTELFGWYFAGGKRW